VFFGLHLLPLLLFLAFALIGAALLLFCHSGGVLPNDLEDEVGFFRPQE
jgi:hypothetical protein